MIELTELPIDAARAVALVSSPRAGAIVLFLGVTRAVTGDRQTASLDYECYPEMARRKLAELEAAARERWPIVECAIIHRLGHLEIEEASVAVAVSSPHRGDAFECGRWLIDTLKEEVPIWKQENWADGAKQWVHPGVDVKQIQQQQQQQSFLLNPEPLLTFRAHSGSLHSPLTDSFGRVHTSLRISVTDRCNIRCFYCMPIENVRFRPRDELLTFEEIIRFASVAAGLGVNKLRLTGGEPLVRAELPKLVAQLATIDGIEDLALTTNGILLDEQAQPLRDAGLTRLNISLDTLDEATFQRISRREGIDRVLAGIAAAQRAGFEKIRLNAVAIRGITEAEIVPLAKFARDNDMELRFIEFMPLDAEERWQNDQVLPGDEIRRVIETAIGPLTPAERPDPSQPATDYVFADGRGGIGFINPVSQPFCGDCNRLRITAEGQIRNCLFSMTEWDARALLRSGGSDEDLASLIRECVWAKKPGHGIDSPEFLRPQRAMYQIGG